MHFDQISIAYKNPTFQFHS